MSPHRARDIPNTRVRYQSGKRSLQICSNGPFDRLSSLPGNLHVEADQPAPGSRQASQDAPVAGGRSSSGRGRPHRQTHPAWRAGLPTTSW